MTSNHADVGCIAGGQYLCKNGQVHGVAPADEYEKRIRRKLSNKAGWIVGGEFVQFGMVRDFFDPLSAWVDAGYTTMELGQHRYQHLADIPSTENSKIPLAFVVDFEEKFGFPVTRHPDVCSQVPCDELAGGAVMRFESLLCILDGNGFNFSSPKGSPVKALGGDQGFHAIDSSCTVVNVDYGDSDKRGIKLDQFAEFSAMLDDIECHQTNTLLLGTSFTYLHSTQSYEILPALGRSRHTGAKNDCGRQQNMRRLTKS